MQADERELPELRGRNPRPRRLSSDSRSELEEIENYQGQSCFDVSSLFGYGGCGVCVSSDGSNAALVTKIRTALHRNSWGDNFCKPERNGKLDDVVEELEVEDTTSLGDDDDDDESSAIDDPFVVAAFSAAAPQRDALWFEIEAVRSGANGLFDSKGWEIVPKGGERYSLNGRCIKLRLRHPGAPAPFFQHLQRYLSAEMAHRASRITVCDGPLRQPLLDYLLQTGQNETYDERGTENIAGVSGAAKLLDFNVAPTEDRIYAMKSAMVQADLRRMADGSPERVSALQRDGAKFQGGPGMAAHGGR